MSEKRERIVFRKGKRIYLRPVLREDVPTLLCWINDEEITQYLKVYMPTLEAEEEEWFAALQKRKPDNLVFAIVTTAGDQLIGNMAIMRINWKDRTATTGAFIGEKTFWSQGYGTEAKMLLLDYAFNTLNLRKLCATAYAFNKRSLAYQRKCGYVEEGRRRRQHYHRGRYWDEVLTAVFKENWLPLWREYKETLH